MEGGDADSAIRTGEAGPDFVSLMSGLGGLGGLGDGARSSAWLGDHEDGQALKGDHGQRCESPELWGSEPPVGDEGRQVSNGNNMQPSKVQGLVEKYDGMAKGTSSLDMALTVKEEGDDGAEEGRGARRSGATSQLTALPCYPIDLSHLEDLFPGTRPSSVQPESLPDTIVDDTFTSIAQRKAWYRISRFGSIRKHNHGGDGEAHVRVSWKDSHTRKAVLTTVRRWMEEDSLGGRVLLGRRLGHASASMFNWDLKAPGVQIGELLSQKRGKSHARQAPATPRIPIQEDTATSPTVPTGFSSEWHAGPSPSNTTCSHGAPRHSQRLSELASSSDDEDEDDWGEMVSSPAIDTGTLFRNASNGFAHPRPSSVDASCATPGLSHGFAGLASPSPEFSTSLSDRAPDSSTGHDGSAVDPNPWHGLGIFKDESVTWTVDEHTPRKPMNPAATITGDLPTSPTMGAVESHPFALPTPVDIDDHRDDEIVESVLRGLPNLSYMLR